MPCRPSTSEGAGRIRRSRKVSGTCTEGRVGFWWHVFNVREVGKVEFVGVLFLLTR